MARQGAVEDVMLDPPLDSGQEFGTSLDWARLGIVLQTSRSAPDPFGLAALLLLQLLLQLEIFLPLLLDSLSLMMLYAGLSHARGFPSLPFVPSFGLAGILPSSLLPSFGLVARSRRGRNTSKGNVREASNAWLFNPSLYRSMSCELLSPPPLLQLIDPGLLLGKQSLCVFQLSSLLLHFLLVVFYPLHHPLPLRCFGK